MPLSVWPELCLSSDPLVSVAKSYPFRCVFYFCSVKYLSTSSVFLLHFTWVKELHLGLRWQEGSELCVQQSAVVVFHPACHHSMRCAAMGCHESWQGRRSQGGFGPRNLPCPRSSLALQCRRLTHTRHRSAPAACSWPVLGSGKASSPCFHFWWFLSCFLLAGHRF